MAGSSTKKKEAAGKKTSAKTSGKAAGKRKTAKDVEQDTSFLQSEAVVLGIFAVSVFLFLSNFHICGTLGNILSNVMLGVFGTIGYVAPLLLFAGLLFYASNKGNIRAVYKMLAVEILLLVLCGLAQLMFGGGYQEGQTLKEIYDMAGESGRGGGVIGGALVLVLHTAVGTIGAYLVLLVFMIICIVCITEKSFVSAVKRGSGKAYQYAKEDYGRRKVIREERKEEKRLLREEQRVQGVNLNSTDLSKGSPMPVPEMDRMMERGGMAEGQDMDQARYAAMDENVVGVGKAGKMSGMAAGAAAGTAAEPGKKGKASDVPVGVPEAGNSGCGAEKKEETVWTRPDPADVFKGKITYAGREPEEDVVPFEEDVALMRHHMDEDVFVSRSSSDFDAMGVFPEREQLHRKEAAPVKTEEIPEIPEMAGEEESWREEVLGGLGTQEPETDALEKESEVEIAAAKPEQLEDILNTEPYVENEEYWEPLNMAEPEETVARAAKMKEPESEWPETEDAEAFGEPEETVAGAGRAAASKQYEEVIQHEEEIQYEELQHLEEPKRYEETREVVTSSGKVIVTDAEEIIKQKAKERKLEAAERKEADAAVRQEVKKSEEKPKKPYVIPPMDLLKQSPGPSAGQSEKEFKETAIKLQQTLRNFGVGVTVTNISCGPTVTRYELHPEQGVKVSKIQSLADDIKLNLAATDIRIEAPIPGKAAVGIEVPNKVNSIVYLRELLESEEFRKHPSRLAFAVGKDIGGQVIVADLAKMPHLLIAGQTGSGKSVGINTMIMSLIYRASPDDVKLIMVDPKVVELSVYNKIPHLLIPVVTDPKKAAGALNWAVAEMMDRYNKFAQSNVRDLKGYNARIKAMEDAGDVPEDQIPAKLPQLVIIIDELADLMMVASNEVEDAICRLAQLARAAGIHLVIATQRPSVNVITGVIKANVPSRIAFSVASGVDSRTILDMNGAEKLLGNGDMLFYPSGYPKPIRVQGAFVSDQEVSAVTDFLKEQYEDTGFSREVELKMSQSGGASGAGGGNDRDALFTDAGRFIIEKDKASIGMLQRMFKIGFNRAARIMDQLAEAGVVGEEEGTKPRKVLMSMEEFDEFIEAGY